MAIIGVVMCIYYTIKYENRKFRKNIVQQFPVMCLETEQTGEEEGYGEGEEEEEDDELAVH